MRYHSAGAAGDAARGVKGALRALLLGVAGCGLFAGGTAEAQGDSLLLRDSFPLGSGGGSALCQVQSRTGDSANAGAFDRTWAIVCRDSALPVGYVFALRNNAGDPAVRLAERRRASVDCTGALPAAPASWSREDCRWRSPDLGYEVLRADRGKVTYIVEGFSAYHGALSLAVRSIMADKALDEPIEVATTSIDDSEAYARIQALTLDPATALAEGYRRNNSGDYADAAAYFETLDQRQASQGDVPIDRVEFLVNAALQRSNLGQFAEAEALFARADAMPAGTAAVERLRRNYEAIHLLNREKYAEALDRLGVPLRTIGATGADALRERMELTPSVARRVNSSDNSASAIGMVDDLKLTEDERSLILDAQALHLKGSALRLLGRNDDARQALRQGLERAIAIRNGRVVSIVRMRSQMMTELAAIDESEGKLASAEALLRGAMDIVGVQYPDTRSLAVTQARLASFLTRHGKQDEALKLYHDVVARSIERRNGLSGLSRQMSPYLDMLVARMGTDPAASGDFLAASQIIVRPGVAETQAVLSRELSAGSDDAARLFRQSVSLGRSIERARMQFAALQRLEDAASRKDEIAQAQQMIQDLEAQEQTTVVQLAAFARYRVVSQRAIPEAELKAGLAPGEAYVKMAALGPDVFVYFATKDKAVAYRVSMTGGEIQAAVARMRDSISKFDGRQYVTNPFDVKDARGVYRALFDPVAADMASVHHLIFEPDGALLSLPANLLITDDASLAAYQKQADNPAGDPFDMRGVAWLGRDRIVSTSVSARSFMESRKQPLSKAHSAYLGLGHNATVSGAGAIQVARMRGMEAEMDRSGCDWPLAAWNRPISQEELVSAQKVLRNEGTDLMIGAAFSDTAIKARRDLADFRILHFATHGLVTPPREDCPTRPALLTSFGPAGSDGLLSFSEIFDLKLDADLVILSACDTAGQADISVTRETGLATGGGSALEGLVRAFIGAGGRAVLASHWPAPDDFMATTRLIGGLFEAVPGESSGEALLKAQRKLMDDVDTSHPYYWAGFAVIGDAARPLLRDTMPAAGAGSGTAAERVR